MNRLHSGLRASCPQCGRQATAVHRRAEKLGSGTETQRRADQETHTVPSNRKSTAINLRNAPEKLTSQWRMRHAG
jgi:hypothetical protein